MDFKCFVCLWLRFIKTASVHFSCISGDWKYLRSTNVTFLQSENYQKCVNFIKSSENSVLQLVKKNKHFGLTASGRSFTVLTRAQPCDAWEKFLLTHADKTTSCVVHVYVCVISSNGHKGAVCVSAEGHSCSLSASGFHFHPHHQTKVSKSKREMQQPRSYCCKLVSINPSFLHPKQPLLAATAWR